MNAWCYPLIRLLIVFVIAAGAFLWYTPVSEIMTLNVDYITARPVSWEGIRNGLLKSIFSRLGKDEGLPLNDTAALNSSSFAIKPLYPKLLVYNGVPKCASTALTVILNRLSKINGFRRVDESAFGSTWLPIPGRRDMEEKWLNDTKGGKVCYTRHFFFLETERYPKDEMAWINLVRDPVERFISHFYFIRLLALTAPGRMSEKFLGLRIDDCVSARLPECVLKQGDIAALQLSYFCGQFPHCRVVGNRRALQEAKANVVQHYAVVGLTEDLPSSLMLMEYYLPEFFSNYSQVKEGSGRVKVNQIPEAYSLSVSNATRSFLRNSMKEDIELYQFVRQRFYKQLETINNLRNKTQ